jgi:hypothetical protein
MHPVRKILRTFFMALPHTIKMTSKLRGWIIFPDSLAFPFSWKTGSRKQGKKADLFFTLKVIYTTFKPFESADSKKEILTGTCPVPPRRDRRGQVD